MVLPNMYFLATSLHSSLRFHAIFNYVFRSFFMYLNFSLSLSLSLLPIHPTFPRVLTPSLTHYTYQPHDPSLSPLQRVFSPFTFLYSTHGAANTPFTQSHHSLHLFLPLYSHTPLLLFPPVLLPHLSLTTNIHHTGIPIPVINNALSNIVSTTDV